MKQGTRHPVESPARRLEILYIASLSAIALLSVVSQAFILRELTWHNDALRPISLPVRQRTLDRSLSLAALSYQGAEDAKGRQERADALRHVLAQWKNDATDPHSPADRSAAPADTSPEVSTQLKQAEPHRLSALRASEALLAAADDSASSTTKSPKIDSLVQTVIAEEDAYCRAIGQAVLETEREVAGRMSRLKSLEFRLFGLMVAVLVLEGLFVISPAVRKIRHIMAEMAVTQEGLKTYAARLERSNLELQDFASVASHDLQEPLRKVMAFSDRLKSKYGAALDDQGRDYLDRVQNAARRMQTLINDLLTYARVTTKAQPFVPTDLGTATRDVVSDLEVRIEQVKGKVEVGELPEVEADPLQVRQLMQNLIGNALKYHRPEEPPVVKVHSKLLKAHAQGPHFGNGTVTSDAPARDMCQIFVEDNGIGFDEVYTDRIFTIFQRLHGRSEYEGTGVGLAVCRKIVERHGGSITARSTPGKGSTFMVTLPVRQLKEKDDHGSE